MSLRFRTNAIAAMLGPVALVCLACIACSPDGPHVALDISAGTNVPALNKLARLRLIVRPCGTDKLAYLENIDTSQPLTQKFEAAVAPGQTFYVWVQGWAQCMPDPGTMCVPEANGVTGRDCECFTDLMPMMQREVEEYCSPWMQAAEGRTQLTAVLGPVVVGTCPPMDLADCNKLQ
jgi:hypothetical protein